jgi:hypothetical protein
MTKFKKLVKEIKKEEPGINYAPAIAAEIGRKKYGDKQFQEMALQGKKRKVKKRSVK